MTRKRGKPAASKGAAGASTSKDATFKGKVKRISKAATKANPFEKIHVKKKFDVIGTKNESVSRNRSREQAFEKRKNTLLIEYKDKSRGNVFIDKRIGENDEDMPMEDKMLKRFQKERMKSASKFSLDDDADEDVLLTHAGEGLGFESHSMGGSLGDSTIRLASDSFAGGAKVYDQEEDDEDDVGGLFKRKRDDAKDDEGTAQTGPDGERKKTKKEIMQEIIAKSKLGKYERAQEKEKRLDMIDELDTEWTEIAELVSQFKNKSEAKFVPDDYDIAVKELASDMKSRPQDRLKTAEEIALEERARLEKLEQERLRRMRGEISDEEEEAEGDEEDGKKSNRSKKAKKEFSADALDEDLAYMVDDSTRPEGGGDEEEEFDEDDYEDGEGEDEEDFDKLMDEYNSEEEEEEEEAPKAKVEKKKKPKLTEEELKVIREQASKEIPFVIEVPETYQDFFKLVSPYDLEKRATIIERIRASNHKSLSPLNTQRLQRFLYILFEHFENVSDSTPIRFAELDLLTKHIYEMTQEYAEVAKDLCTEILRKMQSDIVAIYQQKQQYDEKPQHGFPSASHLLFLKLMSVLFPVTDFFHKVTTPALVYMNQCLVHCPVRSMRDVAAGLYLCSMVLHYTRDSGRFSPEALVFLTNLLSTTCSPTDADATTASPASRQPQRIKLPSVTPHLPTLGTEPWLYIPPPPAAPAPAAAAASSAADMQKSKKTNNKKDQKKEADTTPAPAPTPAPEPIQPLNFNKIMSGNIENLQSDSIKLSAWNAIYELVKGFAAVCSNNIAFDHLFNPVIDMLSRIDASAPQHPTLQQNHSHTLAQLTSLRDQCTQGRFPLQLQRIGAQEIKQYNPLFYEVYTGSRYFDKNRNVEQKKRLKAQLRQEYKNAARELRKDNEFMAIVKDQEERRNARERKQKYKEIMQLLETQHVEAKQLDLANRADRRKKRNERKKNRMRG